MLDLILSLLLLFSPFERLPTWQLFGVDIRFTTALGLLLVLWLAALALRKKFDCKFGAPEYLVLALLMLAWLSLIYAPDKPSTIIAAGSLTFTAVVGLAVGQLLRKPSRWPEARKMLLLVLLGLVVVGFWQFWAATWGLSDQLTFLAPQYDKLALGYPRIQGFSKEPLYFANFLLFLLPLPLLSWFSARAKDSRLGYLLLGLGGLVVFLLPIARSANLAFVGAFLITLLATLLVTKQPAKWIGWLLAAILGSVLLTAGSFALADALPESHGLLHTGSTNHSQALDLFLLRDVKSSESGQRRLETMREALRLGREHPWLGVGMGNFGSQANIIPTPYENGHPVVNNLYLELLSELGFVGLGLALVLFFVLLRDLWLKLRQTRSRIEQAEGLWLLFAFLGTLFQYLFFSTFYILPVWIMLGFVRGYALRETE